MNSQSSNTAAMTTLQKLGVWYVLAIPIVAGISTFSYEVNGFNYTGYIWTLLFGLGLCLLLIGHLTKTFQGGIAVWWPWGVWFGWVWLSLFSRDEMDRRSVQEAAQLCMPIIVGMVASSVIRSREQVSRLLAMFGITFVALAGFTALYVAETNDKDWLATLVRSAALTTMLTGCVFLAAFPARRLVPLAGWAGCILMTTLTSSRMATLGLLMALVLHPGYRSKFWNFAAIAAAGVIGLALFYTPTFQEHFFAGGSGTVDDLMSGDFTDYGRKQTWSRVWEKGWEHPVIGSGTGSAWDFLETVWVEHYVHNDYLRVFFEFGIIGLAFYLGAIFWQAWVLYAVVNSTDGILRTAAIAAWLGVCCMLLSSYTDNTLVNHTYYTNPLFAIIGAVYGILQAEGASPAFVAGRRVGGQGAGKLLRAMN